MEAVNLVGGRNFHWKASTSCCNVVFTFLLHHTTFQVIINSNHYSQPILLTFPSKFSRLFPSCEKSHCEHLKVNITKKHIRYSKKLILHGEERLFNLRFDEVNDDGTVTLVNDRVSSIAEKCPYFSDSESDWERLKR